MKLINIINKPIWTYKRSLWQIKAQTVQKKIQEKSKK